MKSAASASLVAISLLCALSFALPARAEGVGAAQTLFDDGVRAMQEGDFAVACKAFEESLRLEQLPRTAFGLAVCESRWGRVATAVQRYDAFLRMVGELPPAEQKKHAQRAVAAKEERDKLAPEVPTLTLALPPEAPRGTVVERDGEVVAEAALGIAVPVDPGEHVLSTQVPGGPLWEHKITIAKGEKRVLALDIELPRAPSQTVATGTPPRPSPPLAPRIERTSSGRRTAAYVIGGAGLAGLALGGIMGGLTLRTTNVIEEHCGAGIGRQDATTCDRIGVDAASTANATALTSTIGFALGISGVGAAMLLFWTEPKRENEAKSGASSDQRWISAGVLSAGPNGAMLGAKGAF